MINKIKLCFIWINYFILLLLLRLLTDVTVCSHEAIIPTTPVPISLK